MKFTRSLLAGIAAGAAGTTALNTVTYLDMAIRGRGSSNAPEDTVEALAEKIGQRIPGDEDTGKNRLAGLGPLTGLFAGIGTGASLGLARAAGWATPPDGCGTDHWIGCHGCHRWPDGRPGRERSADLDTQRLG